MKNYIYIHICCINNWKDILIKLLSNIRLSGLYDNIDEIRCVVLGINNYNDIFNDPKIKIIYHDNNINLYEFKTMELIYNDSLNEDFNILYLHTKGITHYRQYTEQYVKDWVDMLIYFNINKYNICLDNLNENDVVGVNLQPNPWHFSGNFWWSKSSHIKTLGLIEDKSYNGPEFYITKKKEGKYLSLWNSNVNHYETKYSYELYLDKIKLLSVKNHLLC